MLRIEIGSACALALAFTLAGCPGEPAVSSDAGAPDASLDGSADDALVARDAGAGEDASAPPLDASDGGCAGDEDGCAPHETDASTPVADASSPSGCEAQRVRGEGACDMTLGWAWDGAACAPISGCTCVGDDCGELAEDEGACLDAHSACFRTCGGFAGLRCDASEFCDYPEGSRCGASDRLGLCRPRPTECLLPGGAELCGCDGVTYIGECAANLAGTDVAHAGPCEAP